MIEVLLACFTLAAGAQDPPTFGVGVDAVRVDVFVGRGGRSVKGLTSGDFEVLDNGMPQNIRLIAREQTALHAVLLLDVSGSVAGRKLQSLKDAVRAFLAGLGKRDRTTLLAFSYDVRRIGHGRVAASEVAAAMDTLLAGGATALHDAAYLAIATAASPADASVVLLFSDGQDRLSWLSAETVVDAARGSPSPVYTVFLADRVVGRQSSPGGPPDISYEETPAFLRGIAMESGGRLLRATSPEDLTGHFQAIIEEAKDRYILVFQPAPDAAPGWHDLEVRVRARKVSVQARRGYYLSR